MLLEVLQREIIAQYECGEEGRSPRLEETNKKSEILGRVVCKTGSKLIYAVQFQKTSEIGDRLWYF